MLNKVKVEFTLYKSGFKRLVTNRWVKTSKRDGSNVVDTGNEYLTFNTWLRIPYSDLTPEKWEQYTGLKFHEEKK